MKAYLLAGGGASRLAPFNEYRNKAALLVGNTPLAKLTADALLAAGVKEIVLAGSHQMDELVQIFFADPAVTVLKTKAGSGNNATLAQALAASPPKGDYLVLFADTLYSPADLKLFLASHKPERAAGTVLLGPVLDTRQAKEQITCLAQDGLVKEIIGHKPFPGLRRLHGLIATAGLTPYLAEGSGLFLDPGLGGMPPQETFLETGLAFALKRGQQLAAVSSQDEIIDIDKPWQIMAACRIQLARLTGALKTDHLAEGASIDPSVQRQGFIQLGKNSRIGRNCVIKGNLIVGDNTVIDNGAIIAGPALVGDNVTITDYCHIGGYSTIGPWCRILHAAEFGGVLFERVYLSHYMEISGLLGNCVDIGAATVCGTLRFDNAESSHRIRGRREQADEYANCTYIGDYSRTGVNTIFMPGVIVGCNCAVGPGVIVSENIASGQMVLVKQELDYRPWGPQRHGW